MVTFGGLELFSIIILPTLEVMSGPFKPFLDSDEKYVGNSPGAAEPGFPDGRGRIHTKIANKPTEPIPITISGGSILAGIVYDFVKATYPNATTEIYEFKNGGSGGSTTATVTVTYTDSTKEFIDEVTKV